MLIQSKEKTHDHVNQCGKGTAKIQHPFMIKTFNKLGIEENFFNMIMGIYEKSTANICNGERLKLPGTK